MLAYVKYVLMVPIFYMLVVWVAVPLLVGPVLIKRGWKPPERVMKFYSGRDVGLLPGLSAAVFIPLVCSYLLVYVVLFFV